MPDLPEEWLLDGVGVMPATAHAGPPPGQRKPVHRASLSIVDPPAPAYAVADVDEGPGPVYREPAYREPAPHGASADGGGFTLLGLDDNDRSWGDPGYLMDEPEEKPWGRILVWSVMAVGLAIWLAFLAVHNPDWRKGALQTLHLAQSQMTTPQSSSGLPAPAAPATTEASQPAAVEPAAEKTSPDPTPAGANPSNGQPAPGVASKEAASASPNPAAPDGSHANPAAAKPTSPATASGKDAKDAATVAEKHSPDPKATADTKDARSAKATRAAAEKPDADAEDHADDALVTRAQTYLRYRGSHNCSQAMTLLQQAAAHGNSRASSQLGALYATGSCTRQDRALAYHYFSRAAEAEPTNAYLKHDCDMLWQQMSPQERRRVLE